MFKRMTVKLIARTRTGGAEQVELQASTLGGVLQQAREEGFVVHQADVFIIKADQSATREATSLEDTVNPGETVVLFGPVWLGYPTLMQLVDWRPNWAKGGVWCPMTV